MGWAIAMSLTLYTLSSQAKTLNCKLPYEIIQKTATTGEKSKILDGSGKPFVYVISIKNIEKDTASVTGNYPGFELGADGIELVKIFEFQESSWYLAKTPGTPRVIELVGDMRSPDIYLTSLNKHKVGDFEKQKINMSDVVMGNCKTGK